MDWAEFERNQKAAGRATSICNIRNKSNASCDARHPFGTLLSPLWYLTALASSVPEDSSGIAS